MVGDSPAAPSLLPRQVVLNLNAAAKMEDGKKRKKNPKKAEDNLNADPQRRGALIEEARPALLRSIESFLETYGFSRTLAAFRSEAQLEMDSTKTTPLNLEELLCGVLYSSKTSCNEICTLSGKQDNKDTNDSDKGNECGTADLKSELGASKPHEDEVLKRSKKKHKNRSVPDAIIDHGPSLNDESREELQDKKKRRVKEASDLEAKSGQTICENLHEFVQDKLEDLKSLIGSDACQLNEPTQKSKTKKKHTTDFSTVDATCVGSTTTEAAVKVDLETQVPEQDKKKDLGDNATIDAQPEPKAKKKKKNSSDVTKKDGCFNANQLDKTQVMEEDTSDSKAIKSKRKKSSIKDETNVNGSSEVLISKKNKKRSHMNEEKLIESSEGGNLKKKQKNEGTQEDSKSEDNTADGACVQDYPESVGANAKSKNDTPTSLNTKKEHEKNSTEPKTVKAFQRVKIDEVKFIDERLKDNSYWAKGGAEVGYGAKAQEVLGQVKGRDFRHEKTKKKRGSYRGGQIDFNSHSIKFSYSDEE